MEIIGPISLMSNVMLTELDLPNVREIGGGVLKDNKTLARLNAPKLEKVLYKQPQYSNADTMCHNTPH